MLLFGAGGQLVEVFKDRALGAAAAEHDAGPADDGADARSTRRSRACAAASRSTWRRSSSLLVRFSQLVVEQRWIKEIDINPLLASPDGLIALDARVVLHAAGYARGPTAAAGDPPLPAAVRCTLDDARRRRDVEIRPIRPEDEPLLVALPPDALASGASGCATFTR